MRIFSEFITVAEKYYPHKGRNRDFTTRDTHIGNPNNTVKENTQRKEYEETRHEDDTYQTVKQKLQNPRLTRLRRLLNREQGRYTV
jgi:hypothetical protein